MIKPTPAEPTPAEPTPAAAPVVPPVGTLMTVQVRDVDGTVHTFYGTRGAIHTVATTQEARLDTRQARWLRVIGAADSPMAGEDPATLAHYLTIHSATGGPFDRGTLKHSGPEHFFSAGAHALSVLLRDAVTVSFGPANREGQRWVQDNLTLDQRREAFVARLRAVDSALAAEASTLFDRVEQQARRRGFAEGMDSTRGH